MFAFLCAPATAQLASFDRATGVLAVPSIKVGTRSFVGVTFQQTDPANYTFTLTRATEQIPAGPAVSTYDPSAETLTLPLVQVGTSTYANVVLQNTGGYLMVLRSASLAVLPDRFADSRVFDPVYYLEANPDLSPLLTSSAQARAHWLAVGLAEGRVGHRNFMTRDYLSLNPSVTARAAATPVAATDDYLLLGIPAGLAALANPQPNEGAARVPVLAQPTLKEQGTGQTIIGFWNVGRNATSGRPGADLSALTGLAVPAPRDVHQWALPGSDGRMDQGVGPVAAQIYNGWLGISNDSRSGRSVWAALGVSPDTPIDVNVSHPTAGLVKPFAAPNSRLVFEADVQIPRAGRTGTAASYMVQYFFMNDESTGQNIAFGTLLFDVRGENFQSDYIAYDACSTCTNFLIATTKLGVGSPWHATLPGTTSYAGSTFSEIRRVGFTVSGSQFITAIRAAKARFTGLAAVSEDPARWKMTNWVIDVETGGLAGGDAWIGTSIRPIRAGAFN